MEKIRLGIIGVGNMGSGVADLIAIKNECPEVELTAICDWNPKRLDWAKETFEGKNIALYADAEEMMKSGLVDSVYIAVPHYDHPALTMKAFEHGLHVMLEKPAGVYTKAVREMNEAAEKSDLTFGMMFQCRTIKVYQKAKEIMDSGIYGQIRSVVWHITTWYRSQAYYDSGSWRATWAGEGGGVLLNQCPHQLDVLQWLTGMPVEVYAKCSVAQWHDVEIEDDVVATFKYPNGAMGTFITSTGVFPGTNCLEIAMDKGTLILEEGKLIVKELDVSLMEHGKPGSQIFGNPKITEINYTFPEETIGGHSIMLNAFANKILHGGKLYAEGREGINSLTLSNAMFLSSWTDSTIKLPMNEDLFYEELKKRIATSKHKVVEDVVMGAPAFDSNTSKK